MPEPDDNIFEHENFTWGWFNALMDWASGAITFVRDDDVIDAEAEDVPPQLEDGE